MILQLTKRPYTVLSFQLCGDNLGTHVGVVIECSQTFGHIVCMSISIFLSISSAKGKNDR